MTSAADIIRQKRDGGELSPVDIQALIAGFMSGDIPDYQMSAWLMAVFFKGLSLDETLALTDALVESGERLDLSSLGAPVVDKHSTGGVGDKVTLVLGPVVSACGAIFGKMSGRGLSHTGGTVDKLEAIPGFRTDLRPQEFISQLREIGLCVAGQTAGLTPADKHLYAIRDVTATVDSNPLVAASIMSKKIAGGATSVLLDVKVGRGSFFRSRGHASGVAHLMRQIGDARGVRTEAVLTSMEQPLGMAVGNSLEVLEAAQTLKGEGPADLTEIVVTLASRLLVMAGVSTDLKRAQEAAQHAINSGAAQARFREWIKSQGGDDSFIDDPGRLPAAAVLEEVRAVSSGYISSIDALEVGRIVLDLGAGRRRMEDAIDHGVGVVLAVKTGDRAEEGMVLAHVHARTVDEASTAATRMRESITIAPEPAEPPPLFL